MREAGLFLSPAPTSNISPRFVPTKIFSASQQTLRMDIPVNCKKLKHDFFSAKDWNDF